MSRVEEILRWTSGPAVLDIGCSGQKGRRSAVSSPWWVHGQLLKNFPETWGLEYDKELVDDLTAAGIDNVHHGNAQDFSLDQKFDTIVAGELIEHLERPGSFLQCAASHLKPGGKIILTTPYPFSIGFVLYSWLRYPRTCTNPEHTMWLCPTTMQQLAERVGLSVERSYLVDHYPPDLPKLQGRIVGRLMSTVGKLLPARMRANSMVFVLHPALSSTPSR